MTNVFYTTIGNKREDRGFDVYLHKLPVALRSHVLKYRRWQDAYATLFGKLLLQAGLEQAGFTTLDLSWLKYSTYQRPYFDGAVDFNISHSGDFVLCIISDECRVGIDIEQIKPIALDDFRDQWRPDEWEEIVTAINPQDKFYEYWTKKEALVKAVGEGLSVPLQQIEIFTNSGRLRDTHWYLNELPIDRNYRAHLATDKEIALPITIRKVDFP